MVDTNKLFSKQERVTSSYDPEKGIDDNIPEGYELKELLAGKPKEDSRKFIVLVLSPIGEEDYDSIAQINRKLIVLEQSRSYTQVIATSDEVVLCKSCGGIFGDPYNGIELKANILKVSNYGGSAWRWSENYTFRFQDYEWQLIGATYDSYFNAKECPDGVGSAGRQLEDINFATRKMQIIHTRERNCTPYEDYWKKFEKKKPIALNAFPGKASQWPNGKIKDGDGKN